MARTSPPLSALSLAALLFGTGCSLAFVRPPPAPDPATGRVECTPNSIAPAADLALSVPVGLAGGMYYAMSHLYDGASSAEALAVMAASAAPFIASAVYGIHQGNDCARAMARQAACDPVSGIGCGALGLPSGTGPTPVAAPPPAAPGP